MRHLSPKLFDWIARIKDSARDSKWRELLCHYREARRAGVEMEDPTVFPLVLKACSNVSFGYGRSVHGFLIKNGFESSRTSVGNSAMDFYSKSGCLDSALDVFGTLRCRDSISWNIMVYGYLDRGDLGHGLRWFELARLDGFEPNDSTLVLVIRAIRDLGAKEQGEILHGFVIRTGFWGVHSVQNSLLSMYGESDTDSARKMFGEMPDRDVIAWSVMVKAYVYAGEARIALQMFLELISEVGVEPDGVTVVSVLKGCASLSNVTMGMSVHGYAIRRGFNGDLFVGNSLIDMYSKCGDLDSAFDVYKDMPRRNKVSWNSMISGFVLNEHHLEALYLFDLTEKDGIEADEVSLASVLQICKRFAEPLGLKSIHCVVLRRGNESSEVVLNSLIDAYAKCSLVGYARKVFCRIKRSEVLWSTMIAGLARLSMPDDAIAVFREMVQAQENPNAVTIINLLEACSVSADLKKSKWAHAIAMRRGFASEVAVGTAILDTYSKCGEIQACTRVFGQIPEKNVVTWTAMISAYSTNGLACKALALHTEMKKQGLKPNSVTALSVLSACSHGGLVEEGISFFKSMAQDHGVEPRPEHYSCVVDMLSRAGKLDAAKELITKIPAGSESNAKAWGSVLSACRRFGNSELGSEAASRVIDLEPLSSTGYLMASSLYASGGFWAESGNVRKLAKERGVRVVAGHSVVYVGGNTACKFVAGDQCHSRDGDVENMVEFLHSCMKVEEMEFGEFY